MDEKARASVPLRFVRVRVCTCVHVCVGGVPRGQMGGFAKRFLTSFDGTKTYGTSLSSHKTGTCERTSIGETSPAMMHVPFVPFLTALTTSLTPRFRAFTFAAFFTACASVLREENAMNGSVLSWSRVGVRESPRGRAGEPHCPSRPSRPGGQGRGQQEPAWRARTLRIFFESFSSAIGLAMADSSLTVPMLAIELYPLPSLSLSLFVALSRAHDRRPHSQQLCRSQNSVRNRKFRFAGTLVFGRWQDFVLE